MQILQDQQQRSARGEVREQPGHPFEEPQPGVGVAGGVRGGAEEAVHSRMGGENRREPLITCQNPEDLGEGQIGQPHIPEIDTVPDDDGGPAFGRPSRDFIKQPGLTDPRVPRDQQGLPTPVPGTLEHSAEAAQFLVPPDQRAAKRSLRHALILASGERRNPQGARGCTGLRLRRGARQATTHPQPPSPQTPRPSGAQPRRTRAQSSGTRSAGPGTDCSAG